MARNASVSEDGLRVARQAFIRQHVLVCNAKPARKYDKSKPEHTYHSLDYSRRKCAKALWRWHVSRIGAVTGADSAGVESVPSAVIPGDGPASGGRAPDDLRGKRSGG